MNFDTGSEFCELGDNSGDSKHFVAIEPVSVSVAVYSVKTRVSKKDFKGASCSRVTFFNEGNIFF